MRPMNLGHATFTYIAVRYRATLVANRAMISSVILVLCTVSSGQAYTRTQVSIMRQRGYPSSCFDHNRDNT